MKKEIKEKINKHIDKEISDECNIKIPLEVEIDEMKNKLDFPNLPRTYKDFLLEYGSLYLKAEEKLEEIEKVMGRKSVDNPPTIVEMKEYAKIIGYPEILDVKKFFKEYSYLMPVYIDGYWVSVEIFGMGNKKCLYKEGNIEESLVDDIRSSWGYKFLEKVNFIPFYWMGNGDYLIINLHKYNPKTKEAPVEYFKHEVLHEYEGKKVDFSKKNKITEETGFDSFGEWLEQLVEDDFEVPLSKKGFEFEEFEEEDWPDMKD